MKIKQNIAISESGFLFDPATGHSFTTNPSGLRIMQLLREGKNKSTILEQLAQEFDTEHDTLERDVNDYLNMLNYFKLTQS
jgi:hypothetical protein